MSWSRQAVSIHAHPDPFGGIPSLRNLPGGSGPSISGGVGVNLGDSKPQDHRLAHRAKNECHFCELNIFTILAFPALKHAGGDSCTSAML